MKNIAKMDDNWYRLECSCGSDDHIVDMEIENDKEYGMTFLNFYTKVHYSYYKGFWKRIKDAFKILFGGILELDSDFIIQDKETIDHLIEILQEGRSCVDGVDAIFKVQKVRENAFLPKKAYDTDAGFDCFTPMEVSLSPGETKLVDLGFRIGLKPGWEAQMRNKSGIVTKRNVFMKLGVGTVDSQYRGPVMVPLVNNGRDYLTFKRGEKVAQMVIKKVPYVTLEEGEVDTNTSRGTGGFGSTGL